MKPIRRLEGEDKYEIVELFIPASPAIDGDSQIPICEFLATIASNVTQMHLQLNR